MLIIVRRQRVSTVTYSMIEGESNNSESVTIAQAVTPKYFSPLIVTQRVPLYVLYVSTFLAFPSLVYLYVPLWGSHLTLACFTVGWTIVPLYGL